AAVIAACTFWLSPSSANVFVSKKPSLHQRSQGLERARIAGRTTQRVFRGAASRRRERRGIAVPQAGKYRNGGSKRDKQAIVEIVAPAPEPTPQSHTAS